MSPARSPRSVTSRLRITPVLVEGMPYLGYMVMNRGTSVPVSTCHTEQNRTVLPLGVLIGPSICTQPRMCSHAFGSLRATSAERADPIPALADCLPDIRSLEALRLRSAPLMRHVQQVARELVLGDDCAVGIWNHHLGMPVSGVTAMAQARTAPENRAGNGRHRIAVASNIRRQEDRRLRRSQESNCDHAVESVRDRLHEVSVCGGA